MEKGSKDEAKSGKDWGWEVGVSSARKMETAVFEQLKKKKNWSYFTLKKKKKSYSFSSGSQPIAIRFLSSCESSLASLSGPAIASREPSSTQCQRDLTWGPAKGYPSHLMKQKASQWHARPIWSACTSLSPPLSVKLVFSPLPLTHSAPWYSSVQGTPCLGTCAFAAPLCLT